MFCPNCGNQIPDGSKFCGGCGAQLGQGTQPAAASSAVAQVRNSKAKWFVLGGAVVVIAVIVTLICVLAGGGKGGAKGTDALLKTYFKAFEKGDEDAIIALFPEQILKYAGKMGVDEMDFLESSDDWMDEYGQEIKSWEVVDEESIDEDELDEVNVAMALLDIKVQEAVTLTVEVETEEGDEAEMEFGLAKIDGKWYLMAVE